MNSTSQNKPEQETKFPDRKQDLDHRDLDEYMRKHNVRQILTQMIAHCVEKRSEDPLQGAIEFLEDYHPPN